jgi:hypothetical protein
MRSLGLVDVNEITATLMEAAPDRQAAIFPKAHGRNPPLQETPRGAAQRPELESFVSSAFARKHGARVRSFMPTLLGLRDPHGRLRGVVGLREAGIEPLYLEQYLDAPIEESISAASGRRVRRHEIVEIGNLAGGNCRAAMRMVAQLPAYLLSRNFSWIAFTATSAVRQILLGFDAPLLELARADEARVTGGGDAWGSYYRADPRVFAGYLPDSWRIAAFQHEDHDH